MQIKKMVLVSFLSSIFVLSLNAEQMKYSNAEIYEKMCSKCHGANGEGNPAKKGPALNDMSAHELEISLLDLKRGGLNQSSGTEHDVMEHNMEQIIEKGMDYDPTSMAKFIYFAHNTEAKQKPKDADLKTGYTVAEIYERMCEKCHGANGEGNPAKKGPALNDMTQHELEISILDLKRGGLNQSSGTDHEVMEHNMKKIIEKGMDYDAGQMANHIFTSFNPEAKKLIKSDSKKTYTVAEIYGLMCEKCHGANGEGNPAKKGPALNDMTQHELEISILDLKRGGLNQSSGTDHEVMEHNMKKIIEKGMDYDAKEMSKFIENNFYKKQ